MVNTEVKFCLTPEQKTEWDNRHEERVQFVSKPRRWGKTSYAVRRVIEWALKHPGEICEITTFHACNNRRIYEVLMEMVPKELILQTNHSRSSSPTITFTNQAVVRFTTMTSVSFRVIDEIYDHEALVIGTFDW